MEDNIKIKRLEPDLSRFFKSEGNKKLLDSGCYIILSDYVNNTCQILEYEDSDLAASEFRQICNEFESSKKPMTIKYPKRIYGENDEVDDGYIIEIFINNKLTQSCYLINPEYY